MGNPNLGRMSQLLKFRKKKPCLFLDADGVLWEDQGPGTILRNPEICAQARELVKRFSDENDYLIIVITNQTSAARNLISLIDLKVVLANSFKRSANLVKIDAVYSCFHHPKAENSDLRIICKCRKPNPKMIFQASRRFNIDLPRSLFIGDRITDIQSANLAGIGHSFLLVNSKMFETNIQEEVSNNGQRFGFSFLPITDLSEVNELRLHKKYPLGQNV
jgi:D-glycero-D-manno-heptose 1,7-bisphosphate phosphatase